MAVVAMMATMTLTSCSKDDDDDVVVPTPEESVVLNCAKPDYLKAGDRVAMISPSYFTPMETIEKAANVVRSWGFEPVIGPNVDKVLDGKIGGTVEERVSDIRWALSDPSIKAILCNRGGYGTIQLIDQLPFDEVKELPCSLTSTEISRRSMPPLSPPHRHQWQLACGWQERLSKN